MANRGNGTAMRGQSLATRVNAHTIAVPFSGCWLWSGAINNKGYGLMTVNGRRMLAHRASFEAVKGAVPAGMLVLHSCDVASCCNPDHLRLGSQLENMREAAARGRCKSPAVAGENHGRAKLTWSQIQQIRSAVGTTTQIGLAHGVSASTVSRIRRLVAWRDA